MLNVFLLRLLIIGFMAISLTGCFKRDERHVNAPCTDSCTTFAIKVSTGLNSATPVKNATVELGWSRPATPLGDPGRLIAKGTTAADGTLHFSFKAKSKELQGGMFYVAVKNGNDFFYQQNGYYGIRRFDTIVNAAVHVPSKATLKLVFKNFHPRDSGDVFEATPTFNSYGSMGYPVEMKTNTGQPSNTFFFKEDPAFDRLELTGTTAGDQYTYFNILIKKNGARTDLRDSIFIPKGQSGTYEVAY